MPLSKRQVWNTILACTLDSAFQQPYLLAGCSSCADLLFMCCLSWRLWCGGEAINLRVILVLCQWLLENLDEMFLFLDYDIFVLYDFLSTLELWLLLDAHLQHNKPVLIKPCSLQSQVGFSPEIARCKLLERGKQSPAGFAFAQTLPFSILCECSGTVWSRILGFAWPAMHKCWSSCFVKQTLKVSKD